MDHKYRGACDACHNRKTRCTLTGPGACLNCQNVGRSCIFSLRDEMGRPRKSSSKAKDKSRKPSSSSDDSNGQPLPKLARGNSSNEAQSSLRRNNSSCNELEVWKSLPESEQSGTSGLRNESTTQEQMSLTKLELCNMTNQPELSLDSYESSTATWHNVSMPEIPSSLPTPPEPNQFAMDFALSLADENMTTEDSMMTQKLTRPSQYDFASPELAKQLTEAMFQLGIQTKAQWKYNEEDLINQATIFQTVAHLCRLIEDFIDLSVKDALGVDQQIESQPSADGKPLHMLVATAIFSVINCYRNLEQTYISLLFKHPSLVSSDIQTENIFTDNIRQQDFTNYQPANLTRAINLVTMDFHLAVLKDAYTMLRLSHLDKHPGDSDYEGEIQRMRTRLQQTATYLRPS